MIRVEVCTGSIGGSLAAWKAGASRIELNSGLETGGLSPSRGTVRIVLGEIPIPVVAMVRPRTGNFIYSRMEKKAMIEDAEAFLALGASGVAAGALLPDGGIDSEFVGLLRRSAGDSQLVFHRAFDLASDPMETATVLRDLGVDRILTSGGEATAWQGRKQIRRLVDEFNGGIEILPGAGISAENAAEIVRFTGCSWIHGSFSSSSERKPAGLMPSSLPDPSQVEIEAVIRALAVFQ